MTTIWQQWEQSGRLNIVPMGQTHTHPLGFFAVGTQDLGSCSAVVIASISRVILSHIPPRTNHEDGDATAQRMMDDVKHCFHSHKQDFESKTRGVVVCAIFRGALALDSQVGIMSRSLTDLSLKPQYRPYNVDPKVFGTFIGQGTVLIVQGPTSPVIYVDNQVVPDPDEATVPTASRRDLETPEYGSSASSLSTNLAQIRATPNESVKTLKSWERWRLIDGELWEYDGVNQTRRELSKCPVNEWMTNIEYGVTKGYIMYDEKDWKKSID